MTWLVQKSKSAKIKERVLGACFLSIFCNKFPVSSHSKLRKPFFQQLHAAYDLLFLFASKKVTARIMSGHVMFSCFSLSFSTRFIA